MPVFAIFTKKRLMQTITIAINDDIALKTIRQLEKKHFISIVEQENMNSPALSGRSLSLSEFKKWISTSEHSPTVSFEAAKSIWAGKRKQLQDSIK